LEVRLSAAAIVERRALGMSTALLHDPARHSCM
jgi:hypothetical protein